MEAKVEQSLDHLWHVWINKYQDARRSGGEDRAHSLYEFKSMLDFLRYGDQVIGKAFEGRLEKVHQQCSHSLPVPILNNVLKCALGTEVTSCPILLSLKATFEAERDRVYPFNGEQAYPHVPSEAVYVLMARTCAWHILKEATSMKEGFVIDTTEGYVMDTSDRMFWSNVYESLSRGDPEDEPAS